MTDQQIIETLKSAVAKAGSQSAWATAHGFSRSFICDVLAGTRDVTDRLATALGFERARGWIKPKGEQR